LISTFLLYTMQTNLRNQPEIHENLLLTYLLCLSLFDVSSAVSIYSLSEAVSKVVSFSSRADSLHLLHLLPLARSTASEPHPVDLDVHLPPRA
jgi:hypothetical protein